MNQYKSSRVYTVSHLHLENTYFFVRLLCVDFCFFTVLHLIPSTDGVTYSQDLSFILHSVELTLSHSLYLVDHLKNSVMDLEQENNNKLSLADGGCDEAKTPPDSLIFQEDHEDFKIQKRQYYSRVVALLLGVATLVAVGLGVYFFLDKDDIDLRQGASQHENFQGTVDMASILLHSQPEDCWMAIHGNVYDMTEYAPIHPGEPTLITRHCGTDATEAYDFEHSTALLPIVDEFRLGTLQLAAEAEQTTAPTRAPITPKPTVSPQPTRNPTLQPSQSPSEPEATKSPTATPTASPTGCPMQFYTLTDVAQHPDANSCWYVLYGVVYDFTDYIDDHKGGRGTILAECGTDATVPYEQEKKHDVSLLIKKGFSSMIIGRLGSKREIGEVPCSELDLVAVTVPV